MCILLIKNIIKAEFFKLVQSEIEAFCFKNTNLCHETKLNKHTFWCLALWVKFQADNTLKYFSYFSQKTGLTFHANCLQFAYFLHHPCPHIPSHPHIHIHAVHLHNTGPSCSKLTTSLVNKWLKFTSNYMQICWNFLLKKMWVAFAVQKLLTFFQQKISEYCILNQLKQLRKWPLTSLLS